MLNEQTLAPAKGRRFTVTRSEAQGALTVLANLMRDTSAPALALLAEQHGLHRIPGLTKEALITRILRHLSADHMTGLEADLIAARYGSYSVDGLVHLALARDSMIGKRPAPRLDQVSPAEATLVEGSAQRWVFTLRGHDVVIDLGRRLLSCDCSYFAFASRRQALCKHLATAFELIPEAYAREALIDLLVSREYGERGARRWQFKGARSVRG
jgi:hypothetical protein